MAYTQFKKLDQLRKAFGIEETQGRWLPTTLPSVKISNHLLENLRDAEEESLRTEKAKSEYVIAPILKELRRNNPNKFSTFSGFEMSVDKSRGLTGFCDFLLSAIPRKAEITAPIFCLVEAKKDDVEKGTAQCGAEMYAAKLYNEQEGRPRKIIYGCVTTAFSWCFLKLEDNTLFIDPNYVPLTFTNPQPVLATLQWVLDEGLKNE
ncbi:MAG: hypothetical protein HC817_05680 [Saprospiraceae bacterium]|nr:hypothetical protein [Saprospiraceae bacterium]